MIFPAEDFIAEAPRPTPLYAAAAAESETNLWTSINGFAAPRIFSSLEAEYAAARSHAVIADLGALARYSVRGEEAASFLSRFTTAPAGRLKTGESARGLILDDNAGVVDLAEVSRLSETLFLLTTPSPHPRRLQLAKRGFAVDIVSISNEVAALGVFGPAALDALRAVGLDMSESNIAASGVLRGVETTTRPIQFAAIAGIELIYDKAEALTLWERLRRRADLIPIGLDALEILRIETGAPRPGVDFISAERARPAALRRPEEIGLAHLAPTDRGWFNGRQALRRAPLEARRHLMTLAIDHESLTPGAAVFADGKSIGRLTSCVISPSLKRVVGFADIAPLNTSKTIEISILAEGDERAPAKRLETAESLLAAAHLDAVRQATEMRR